MSTFFKDVLGEMRSSPVTAPIIHVASDATSDFPIFVAPYPCYIVNVFAHYQDAVTGADTNSQNINIDTRTAAGASAVEIANRDHANGVNAAENEVHQFTFTGTTAQRTLTEGMIVMVEYEEVGTGSPTLGTIYFHVEYRAK